MLDGGYPLAETGLEATQDRPAAAQAGPAAAPARRAVLRRKTARAGIRTRAARPHRLSRPTP